MIQIFKFEMKIILEQEKDNKLFEIIIFFSRKMWKENSRDFKN